MHTYSLTLPSDRTSISAVEPFLACIDGIRTLGDQRYYNMLVAVTEAVNNAIIHGNREDPSKNVDVQIQLSDAELIVLVSDVGAGFDPDDVPDPRHPDRLLVNGGRGVFLIRQLADVAEFYPSSTGMTVLIKFYRS